jgi:hypothetical protein
MNSFNRVAQDFWGICITDAENVQEEDYSKETEHERVS